MEKNKKTEDTMRNLATGVFQYVIDNGGLDIPMLALHEVFCMLSARVAFDTYEMGRGEAGEEMSLAPDDFLKMNTELFEFHFNAFLKGDFEITSEVVN